MHEGRATHRRTTILWTIPLCAVVGLLPAISCSSMVAKLSAEWRNWGYVQRHMGGVTLGEPLRNGRRVTVPVELHYERATLINSAEVVTDLRVTREGNKVWMTLSTGLAGGDQIPIELSLPNVKPGTYEFGYRDPSGAMHNLGTIRL